MIHFFVQPEQINDSQVTLLEEDTHHLRVVLKAKPGDQITVLDGSGVAWPAILTEIGKNRAAADLGERFYPQTEAQTKITVAQALPKMNEKIEQVLQRCTEIGVSEFILFQSERSMSHLPAERDTKRLTRMKSIIKTSAEQSHRALLPTLQISGSLSDILEKAPSYDLALMAHLDNAHYSLHESLKPHMHNILIIIGPESGFTDGEAKQARQARAKIISLGPRILRTETAAMVAASQILYAQEPSPVC